MANSKTQPSDPEHQRDAHAQGESDKPHRQSALLKPCTQSRCRLVAGASAAAAAACAGHAVGSMLASSTADAADAAEAPATNLHLDWVHGFNSADCR
jgi:HELP motif